LLRATRSHSASPLLHQRKGFHFSPALGSGFTFSSFNFFFSFSCQCGANRSRASLNPHLPPKHDGYANTPLSHPFFSVSGPRKFYGLIFCASIRPLCNEPLPLKVPSTARPNARRTPQWFCGPVLPSFPNFRVLTQYSPPPRRFALHVNSNNYSHCPSWLLGGGFIFSLLNLFPLFPASSASAFPPLYGALRFSPAHRPRKVKTTTVRLLAYFGNFRSPFCFVATWYRIVQSFFPILFPARYYARSRKIRPEARPTLNPQFVLESRLELRNSTPASF